MRADRALDAIEVAEQVFTALADPTRRAVLGALASGGPATATDLAARLPVSRQAIAKHLALLADAGLVVAYLRVGDRVFETYRTGGRGSRSCRPPTGCST